MTYEEKFAGFIRAIEKAKNEGVETILIATPHAIGDNYEEIIESLNRLGSARLTLTIATEA